MEGCSIEWVDCLEGCSEVVVSRIGSTISSSTSKRVEWIDILGKGVPHGKSGSHDPRGSRTLIAEKPWKWAFPKTVGRQGVARMQGSFALMVDELLVSYVESRALECVDV